MIDVRLASELRRRGYEVESCQEAGRANQGISDEAQLVYATQQGRALFTFNFVDFLRLDAAWKAAAREHASILLSVEIRDLGELLRRIAWHLEHYGLTDQYDTLLWLAAPQRP